MLHDWVAEVSRLASYSSPAPPHMSQNMDIVRATSQWDVVALSKNEVALIRSLGSRDEGVHQQNVLQNLELSATLILAILNVSIPLQPSFMFTDKASLSGLQLRGRCIIQGTPTTVCHK